MSAAFNFDSIPENTVLLNGDSLVSRHHLPVPPNLTIIIRNPQQPGKLFEILREEYPLNHTLQLCLISEKRELKLADLESQNRFPEEVTALVIPPLPNSFAFETFQETVAALRGPYGCPWDKKQTHQSLRDDLLQEVYELLDGLDRADTQIIIEELGDVLLHILLQAQIGVDNGEFTMGDVIRHINDKIIYRHPHVFGGSESIDPNQISQLWERIKQKEREKEHKKGGLLDGVSRTMPALSQVSAYQSRAAKAGFEWNTLDECRLKLNEEAEEFTKAQTAEEKEEELGDILFTVVNLARLYHIDPETALRTANLKFYDRIHYIEEQAKLRQTTLFELPREEKEKYWNECKKQRKSGK